MSFQGSASSWQLGHYFGNSVASNPFVTQSLDPHVLGRFPHHWAGVQNADSAFTMSSSSHFLGTPIVSLQKKDELGV